LLASAIPALANKCSSISISRQFGSHFAAKKSRPATIPISISAHDPRRAAATVTCHEAHARRVLDAGSAAVIATTFGAILFVVRDTNFIDLEPQFSDNMSSTSLHTLSS
jgi:hypothetical protein